MVIQNLLTILLFDDNIKVFKTEEHEKMMYVLICGVLITLTNMLNMKQLSYMSRITMILTFVACMYVLFYTLISFYFHELEQENLENLLYK